MRKLLPRVTILLSTYNGEKYLKSQLDSIAEQSYRNWVIAWRDDGSQDGSCAIVETFTQSIGAERCRKSASSGPHLGAPASFLKLLAENANSDFVAFADQDDHWMPAKLQRGLDLLGPQANTPTLYCSRQLLTDEDLSHPMLSVDFPGRPGFPASLTQNIATGNTIIMNRVAADLISSIPIAESSPHDWWSYIIVTACGGKIVYDPQPYMLYRQHNKNLVGSQLPALTRAIAALERGSEIYMTMMRRHTERLYEHRDKLSTEALADLKTIRKGLRGTLADRLAALRLPYFARATRLETLLFRIWFLLS